jgi:ACR3 family arsenite efflux pump ArsB
MSTVEGGAAVSAALMLCVFYMIYPMIMRIAAANLELSRMDPDVLKLGYSMMNFWSIHGASTLIRVRQPMKSS